MSCKSPGDTIRKNDLHWSVLFHKHCYCGSARTCCPLVCYRALHIYSHAKSGMEQAMQITNTSRPSVAATRKQGTAHLRHTCMECTALRTNPLVEYHAARRCEHVPAMCPYASQHVLLLAKEQIWQVFVRDLQCYQSGIMLAVKPVNHLRFNKDLHNFLPQTWSCRTRSQSRRASCYS